MKLTLLALSASALMSFQANASFNDICKSETDGYTIVIDVSGSMMQGEDKLKKIELARNLALKIATNGDQSLNSALYTISPFTVQLPLSQHENEDYRKAIEAIPTNLETVGRLSWMGSRGAAIFNDHNSGKKALIVISDGDFTTYKASEKLDPKSVFADFKQAVDGNKLYAVTLEKDAESLAKYEEATGEKAYAIEDLLNNDKSFTSFINTVFASTCSRSIELYDVNFAFNKYDLNAKAMSTLDDILPYLKERSEHENILIEGWTDHCGSDAYNAKLSERRAQSVKQYLVSHGLDANKLETQGKGKSFKFDNNNSQGRYENRHVHLVFIPQKQ